MPVFPTIFGTDQENPDTAIETTTANAAAATVVPTTTLPKTTTLPPAVNTPAQNTVTTAPPVTTTAVPPAEITPTTISTSSAISTITSSSSTTSTTSTTSSSSSITTSSTSSSISSSSSSKSSVVSASSRSSIIPPSISSPISTPLSNKVSSSSPISTGVAIAIAAGGLAAIAIFLVVFKFVRRRLKAERDDLPFDRSESHMILDDDYAGTTQPGMYEPQAGVNSIYSNPEPSPNYMQQHERDSFGNNVGNPYDPAYPNNAQHDSWSQPGSQSYNPQAAAAGQYSVPQNDMQYNPYSDQHQMNNDYQTPANYYGTGAYQQPPQQRNPSPNYGAGRQSMHNPDDAYGGI